MSKRAAQMCSDPACPNLQPCPIHATKPWKRRTKRSTLSGWAQQRRAKRIIAAADTRCGICGRIGATEVDHITPITSGGADDDGNLQPIHHDCHAQKTKMEAKNARRNH